jgi:hypothetical protein
MKPHQAPPSSQQWTPASIFSFALGSVLLLIALPLLANRYWNQPLLWISVPLFYLATALWLRSRLMICALVGLMLGAMLIDGERGNQSETYQVWQPVWAIGVGLLIGIVIGVIWDRAQNFDAGPKRTRAKKRR